MSPEKETAAPAGTGNGGIGKVIGAATYRNSPPSATEFAPLVIAERFRLPIHMARTVCELAAIGGRLA